MFPDGFDSRHWFDHSIHLAPDAFDSRLGLMVLIRNGRGRMLAACSRLWPFFHIVKRRACTWWKVREKIFQKSQRSTLIIRHTFWLVLDPF